MNSQLETTKLAWLGKEVAPISEPGKWLGKVVGIVDRDTVSIKAEGAGTFNVPTANLTEFVATKMEAEPGAQMEGAGTNASIGNINDAGADKTEAEGAGTNAPFGNISDAEAPVNKVLADGRLDRIDSAQPSTTDHAPQTAVI